MKRIFNYILSTALILGAVSCGEDEILDQWIADNPPAEEVPVSGDPGDLNLSNLVVLGTSLASGIQDGALFNAGQSGSFPNLLGAHFQIDGLGGTAAFGQPDINSVNGYNMLYNDGTSGRTQLDLSLRAPVPTTGDPASLGAAWGGTTSTLNNFGIPLAYAGQFLTDDTSDPFTSSFNPFYRRFASVASTNGSTGSIALTDAISAGGSFFIYEAGINDILLYAAGGGTTAIGPITSSGAFEAYADIAIHALASAGTSLVTTPTYSVEGLVLNVPPILVFPFFQAVQWDAIAFDANDPVDVGTVAALNDGFEGLNGAIDFAVTRTVIDQDEADARYVSYATGSNPILVVDQSLTDLGSHFDFMYANEIITLEDRIALEPFRQSRPLAEGEIVPLSTATKLGVEADGDDENDVIVPYGVVIPLGFDYDEGAQETLGGDPYYIDFAEQVEIETARALYNVALAGAVADVNNGGGDIALVDIASIFLDAAGLSDGVQGITVQGLNLSPDFAPNGIFSTDGIHPCQRGHAIIANKIIATMNSNWNASIPEIEVAPVLGPYFIP